MNRLLWIMLAIYWLTIFTLTHIPQEHLVDVSMRDKTAHLLAFGLLGGLLYCGLWKSARRWGNIEGMVLLIGMSYGALDEWLQAISFVHRSCDLNDWFADCTGIAIAVGVLSVVRWWGKVKRKT